MRVDVTRTVRLAGRNDSETTLVDSGAGVVAGDRAEPARPILAGVLRPAVVGAVVLGSSAAGADDGDVLDGTVSSEDDTERGPLAASTTGEEADGMLVADTVDDRGEPDSNTLQNVVVVSDTGAETNIDAPDGVDERVVRDVDGIDVASTTLVDLTASSHGTSRNNVSPIIHGTDINTDARGDDVGRPTVRGNDDTDVDSTTLFDLGMHPDSVDGGTEDNLARVTSTTLAEQTDGDVDEDPLADAMGAARRSTTVANKEHLAGASTTVEEGGSDGDEDDVGRDRVVQDEDSDVHMVTGNDMGPGVNLKPDTNGDRTGTFPGNNNNHTWADQESAIRDADGDTDTPSTTTLDSEQFVTAEFGFVVLGLHWDALSTDSQLVELIEAMVRNVAVSSTEGHEGVKPLDQDSIDVEMSGGRAGGLVVELTAWSKHGQQPLDAIQDALDSGKLFAELFEALHANAAIRAGADGPLSIHKVEDVKPEPMDGTDKEATINSTDVTKVDVASTSKPRPLIAGGETDEAIPAIIYDDTTTGIINVNDQDDHILEDWNMK